MLGCKFFKLRKAQLIRIELIDTCWDVNASSAVSGSFTFFELIDTCWDVNMFCLADVCKALEELIDTCWDVNMYEGLDEHSPSKN